MPHPNTTSFRLAAAFLTVTSVLATFYLGRLLIGLLFYYGTPGQSPQFYLVGCLVLFAIAVNLLALWAADCAEHVLPLFEAARPLDARPRHAPRARDRSHRQFR